MTFVYSPDTVAQNYVQWAKKLQNFRGIDYGCVMDNHIIPLHPGDLMAVVARPGHGKSSFMAYMAKRAATLADPSKNQVVLYISWEQSIEEIEAFFQSGENYSSTDLAWGRVDVNAIERQSVKRAGLPIWMIGYSINDSNKRREPMTIDVVYEAIKEIRYERGYEPILICLDYLQIIPVHKARERMEQVTEATIQAKHLAMEVGVPIIAGVQATRRTDERFNQLPTMSDAQWSSTIEQTADKQISLMRPIKSMEPGDTVDVGGTDYIVDENLLLIKLLKQRFDVGYGVWAFDFRPQTLILNDIPTNKHRLEL